jgi:predicted RNA-binding Zn-ribbon protein involved in translation (DUF1610 family)
MDITIKYECENCGLDSSYRETYEETLSEGGQRATKAAAQELAKDSLIKVQKHAQETAEIWRREGPEDFTYQHTNEKCPNCGYTQSWMLEYLRHTQRLEIITFPILILTLAYLLLWSAYLSNFLNNLFGDFSDPVAIVIWAVAAGIFYLIRKNSIDPNRDFEDVSQENEPTLIWGEPIITKAF